MVHQDIQDQMVLQEHLHTQDHQEDPDQPVDRDHLDHRDHQDLLDPQDKVAAMPYTAHAHQELCVLIVAVCPHLLPDVISHIVQDR
ncbi:unnamed protein product [Anisakis simplex]|uniref:Uncharacterized protein n=1 Tax=Anisakis simplex TaxID=6269 RepID=A0A3P6QC81_ANISI|nr:unnamed protein product [Anisakis simplex]